MGRGVACVRVPGGGGSGGVGLESTRWIRTREISDKKRSRFWCMGGVQRGLATSTSGKITNTLYQNIFRGEPAISGFDRHITPNLKSSDVISPTNGAGLLLVLPKTHPAQG